VEEARVEQLSEVRARARARARVRVRVSFLSLPRQLKEGAAKEHDKKLEP